MTEDPQKNFLSRAIAAAQNEPDLLAAGMFADDLFLELGFYFSRHPAPPEQQAFARSLGGLTTSYFEHPGGPLCALYESPAQLARIHFLHAHELAALPPQRMIWERHAGEPSPLAHVGNAASTPARAPELQWVEDRFWVWLFAASQRLASGGVFAALERLDKIRNQMLIPLWQRRHALPDGAAPELLAAAARELRATVAIYEARSVNLSLREAARLYVDLREHLATASLVRHRRAELLAIRHLHTALEPPLPQEPSAGAALG